LLKVSSMGLLHTYSSFTGMGGVVEVPDRLRALLAATTRAA